MNILQQMLDKLWLDLTQNGEKVLHQELGFDD
ncbi:hypothetical protein Lacidipiscis_01789 [Ligilactobacillus acidipiscis]|nr:hypothetical protein Lacidipiscis_01789 [Ligilactobacillus acidipiscis]